MSLRGPIGSLELWLQAKLAGTSLISQLQCDTHSGTQNVRPIVFRVSPSLHKHFLWALYHTDTDLGNVPSNVPGYYTTSTYLHIYIYLAATKLLWRWSLLLLFLGTYFYSFWCSLCTIFPHSLSTNSKKVIILRKFPLQIPALPIRMKTQFLYKKIQEIERIPVY